MLQCTDIDSDELLLIPGLRLLSVDVSFMDPLSRPQFFLQLRNALQLRKGRGLVLEMLIIHDGGMGYLYGINVAAEEAHLTALGDVVLALDVRRSTE